MPRLDAARDQGADPLPRRGGPRARARLPRRGRARCAPTSQCGTIGRWRSSSQSASGASPSTPPPAATRSRRRSCGWRATSRPTRRCRGARGDRARARPRSTATRTPPTRCCAARLSDRYGVPAARIAIGNGSCDILLAAGEALLEPGAELVYAWPSFSVYPHLAAASGARAVTVPLDGARAPRPRRRCCGDHRRHPAGDRLQPQQPHQHRAPARGHRRVPRRGARRTCA